MIKRWIARRRRRIDLFGRMRTAETQLRDVESRLRDAAALRDREEARQDRVEALNDALCATEQRLHIAERNIESADEELRRTIDMAQREMGAKLDRLAETVGQDAIMSARDITDARSAIETATEALHALSVRTARVETQRQLDVEESRKATSAMLLELKRTVVRWRNTETALSQIDSAVPSNRYVGRPSEEFRPSRIRPDLSVAAPFSEVGVEGWLHPIVLSDDGAVVSSSEQPHLPDRGWIAVAPFGSLAAPGFSDIVHEHINAHPDVSIFYADDIAVECDEPIDQVRLKPDFDLTLLAAQDYVGAPLIIRADAMKRLGGLQASHGTAACADILFRANAQGMLIRRIPRVLLAHPGRRVKATPLDYRAMLQAQPCLTSYSVLPGMTLDTFQLQRRFTAGQEPAISILVPTRRTSFVDSHETYLERLLASLAATDWPMDKLTVIVGDDISGSPEWARRSWPFALQRIQTVRAPGEPFNYAAKMNVLWRAAKTEQIVMMNDDVRAIDGGWLRALQTFAMDPGVGGVGARLLFEDGSLQHAGMAPHRAGTAHLWIQRLGSQGIYQDWARVHREWSMVTGAVFATRRSLMEKMNGFDERFSLEFNDTDLALRLRKAGYRIVATPFAQMVHIERASRKHNPPPSNEAALFQDLWSDWLANDPSWHPGLDLNRIEVMPAPSPDDWYR